MQFMSKSGDHQTVDCHFNAVSQFKLSQNGSYMMLDRGRGDTQGGRDFLVGFAEGNKTQGSLFCITQF
jgi:hypothetical protein